MNHRRHAALTPEAQNALDRLWNRNERFADRIEEGLDWIETSPADIRAKRHGFAGGKYAFEIGYAEETWIIVWAENNVSPNRPNVFYIVESFL